MLKQRVYSRDIADLKEDLEASLEFALGRLRAEAPRAVIAQAIVDGLSHFDDLENALLAVKDQLGIPVFGQVILYHLENQTSLMNQAAVMSFPKRLARIGMTVADLGWPNDVLHPRYADA